MKVWATPTFGGRLKAYIKAKGGSWRNAKHRAQWESTLKTYASSITDLPVDEIEFAHAVEVLTPIWTEKSETAATVRERGEPRT